jgi:hypothetical protein
MKARISILIAFLITIQLQAGAKSPNDEGKGIFQAFHLNATELWLLLFAAILSIIGIAGIIVSAKTLKKYKADDYKKSVS